MRISAEKKTVERMMHTAMAEYGASGHKQAGIVKQLMDGFKTVDVLDYGCGKQTLADALGCAIRGYDPAIPGLDTDPEPADIVVCTDVLEHIEEECLDEVLMHINDLTKKVGLLIINTAPSFKYLPDGRNFHICLHPPKWWLNKVNVHMDIQQMAVKPTKEELMIVFEPYGNEHRAYNELSEHVLNKEHRFMFKEDGTFEKVLPNNGE